MRGLAFDVDVEFGTVYVDELTVLGGEVAVGVGGVAVDVFGDIGNESGIGAEIGDDESSVDVVAVLIDDDTLFAGDDRGAGFGEVTVEGNRGLACAIGILLVELGEVEGNRISVGSVGVSAGIDDDLAGFGVALEVEVDFDGFT